MTASLPRAVVVAGPTASGKSALAMAIAEEFKGVVINADSQQCYRNLRILSARPSAENESRVPHRLFGYLQGTEIGSAAQWAVLAAQEIQDAHTQGLLPVVAGGTGLYLRALMTGLSDIPKAPADARAAARALLDDIGVEALHEKLQARDPVTAARLKPTDAQRVLRAWEVLEATGTPLSDWQKMPAAPPIAASYFSILLQPDRQELTAICDARFDAMIAAGALEEVRALLALGLDGDAPVMKALGVPELAAHLRGEAALEAAVAAAKAATRRYAKRQVTWFKHQFNADLSFFTKYSETLSDKIFPKIRHFLLT